METFPSGDLQGESASGDQTRETRIPGTSVAGDTVLLPHSPVPKAPGSRQSASLLNSPDAVATRT